MRRWLLKRFTLTVGIIFAIVVLLFSCSVHKKSVLSMTPTAIAQRIQKAQQGDPVAATNLGLMYTRGDGVPRNDTEAVRWFSLAAQQGYGKAQMCLGMMYAEGRGLPADDVVANKWFLAAANQGIVMAQTNLGDAYATGKGVEVDDVRADMWLSLAAMRDDPKAVSALPDLEKSMTPDQIAEAKRRASEWKPTSEITPSTPTAGE